jgi:hypothetical protein
MRILKSESQGLAVTGTIETAGVPQDALVKITGDNQFDVCGSGDIPVGYVSVPAKDATETDAEVTVEMLRFRRRFSVKFVGGAIAAGAQVKAGAPASGSVSTVAALSSGDRSLLVGIVIVGAAENATGEVLGL